MPVQPESPSPPPPRGDLITEVLPAFDRAEIRRAVAQATRLLHAGQPVALPTETVYGLAANAFDPAAVQAVFTAKDRPAHNPLIVHVASLEMARVCVAEWPETADRLARRFWPGPLTLVLPRSPRIPDIVTAGGPTVAIRWPAHPVMQAVISACGFPLAAPSANRSSRLSPTCAEHVRLSLGGRIPLILDAGPCPVGIESTVLDLTASPPRILRPGGVPLDAIATCLGTDVSPVVRTSRTSSVPKPSPGLLPKHYAPETPVELRSWTHTAQLRRHLEQAGLDPAEVGVLAFEPPPHAPAEQPAEPTAFRAWLQLPTDPVRCAQRLYAALHEADRVRARRLIVQLPPDTPAWAAVRDRLCRAASRDPD